MTRRHPDAASPQLDLSDAAPEPALPVAWPERAAWGTVSPLRAWQQAAMTRYFAEPRRDFLAVATPGAGKTTFALTVAAELLGRRMVDRVCVVAPTEHLKVQWAEAAATAGIPLDPAYSAGKGKTSDDYVGIAVTYAGVAVNPLAMRIRTERFKTLVILDEVHHAGDALSWGEAVREAFQPATRRLALTGTPFRSDVNPIPFVTYAPAPEQGPGALVSVPDFTYGYAHALADHVVRPVLFMAYSGDMQWRTRAGDEVAARLGEPLTKDQSAQALRTALDPGGAWMAAVLEAADRRLSEVRRHVPDAGGLVIATDQDDARAYASLLKQITGEKPTLVLSDEKAGLEADRRVHRQRRPVAGGGPDGLRGRRRAPAGGGRLRHDDGDSALLRPGHRAIRARAAAGRDGVGVPAVGGEPARLRRRDGARARPRAGSEGEQRGRHLRRRGRPARAGAGGGGRVGRRARAALRGPRLVGTFDHVLFDGAAFGHSGEVHVGSEEEMDFLGIPGLLEPDQVRDLLAHRQSRAGAAAYDRPGRGATALASHEQLALLRRELNGLVAAWHHRTGQAHGITHSALRKECGGPPAAVATADQLHARIDRLRAWAVRA